MDPMISWTQCMMPHNFFVWLVCGVHLGQKHAVMLLGKEYVRTFHLVVIFYNSLLRKGMLVKPLVLA